MSSDNQDDGKLSITRRALRRLRRTSLISLAVLACGMTLSALLVTLWLAAQGIQLHALSGISLTEQTIQIQRLTLGIKGTTVDLQEAQLARQKNGWQIDAEKVTLSLSVPIKAQMAELQLSTEPVILQQAQLTTQGP
ncbi:hypothetical protein KDD30_19865 (plasmid) [Photobacterium sp. GJ3]|uniref:hypothetical protein n=1 Tax=Photobacterium sp. GJ3 TaxID=2829502 RepID=UPI001B8D773E|nr:hypothetical protein [Photobacterium sp. GJ3]QUJ70371.1 hypothetical protein KDD30_19865 [Photobacterium sp. GJ3]